MDKKITVTVPTVGRDSFGYLLASLIHQTYRNFDVIIYGEYDQALFNKIILILNNKGNKVTVINGEYKIPANKFKEMIKIAQTEWIVLCGDDEIFIADYFEKALFEINVLKDAGLRIGSFRGSPVNYDFIDVQLEKKIAQLKEIYVGKIESVEDNKDKEWLNNNTLIDIGLMGGGAFINRKAVNKIGGFPTDVFHCEDTVLGYKLYQNGYLNLFNPSILSLYHLGEDGGCRSELYQQICIDNNYKERFRDKIKEMNNYLSVKEYKWKKYVLRYQL